VLGAILTLALNGGSVSTGVSSFLPIPPGWQFPS